MFMMVKRLFSLLTRREKIRLLFVLAAVFLMALVELAGIASILPFMTVVANTDKIAENHWLNAAYEYGGFVDERQFLVVLGSLVLCLLVLSNLAKALVLWLTLSYDNRLNYVLAGRLFGQYLTRPYSFFLGRNTADMGKNVLVEVQHVIAGILSPSVQLLANGTIATLIVALLVFVDPKIAATIVLVLGGAYAIVYSLIRKKLTEIGKQQVFASFMKFKVANEALAGIKDIRILGREKEFLDRYVVHAKSHAKNNVRAEIFNQVPRYLLEILAFGGILMILLYFLSSGQNAVEIVPVLALYTFAGYRLMPALQIVFSSVTNIRRYIPHLRVVYEDMSSGSRSDVDLSLEVPANATPVEIKHELRLNNVTFTYDGALSPALRDVDLSIAANTSVAFVGPTGSGKTTVVDVILGLLPPDIGSISVDGKVVGADQIRSWQTQLGYVPQSIYLSDDTISNNIALGVKPGSIKNTKIRKAAEVANLAVYIERLQDEYDSIIGERGVRLSGGQRQRIGIARAMYRNPPVLILDEATSALDGITEDAVMSAIKDLSGSKTIIMIAHRLSTVRDCDKIFVMRSGEIVDEGTYDELFERNSWFRDAAKENK